MIYSLKKNLHFTLVRHGQSESNKNKTFTGWENANLTKKGRIESTFAGTLLKDANLRYSKGYTSFLIRAIDTYKLITTELSKKTGTKEFITEKQTLTKLYLTSRIKTRSYKTPTILEIKRKTLRSASRSEERRMCGEIWSKSSFNVEKRI